VAGPGVGGLSALVGAPVLEGQPMPLIKSSSKQAVSTQRRASRSKRPSSG